MLTSVIIPTFRRPEGVELAVKSVMAQTRLPGEVVVVDNCPQASAQTVIARLTETSPVPLIYHHEPEAGVANARNAGLARARGRMIAFLDDDEIARPHWLSALLDTRESLDVDVVFGPLSAVVQGELPRHQRALAERLYSRIGSQGDAPLEKPFGCGNSLIDRGTLPIAKAPFNPALNETGGEDDDFFDQLERAGARFGWSAAALAYECVPPSRIRWRYLMTRSFSFGQGPSQACARSRPVQRLGVARWMLIGLAQMMVFGPLTMVGWVFGLSKTAEWLDRTAQGAGKIFWWDQFEPRLYGNAAINTPADHPA